jgi:uncharacterized RDD family membrane protein YckC
MNCTNHPDVIAGVVSCARCGGAFCPDCVVEIDGQPYDAACKEEQIRDLRSGSAGLAYATAGRRFSGMFVDGLIFLVVAYLPTVFWAASRQAESPRANPLTTLAVQVLVPGILFIIYEAVMLSRDGQTLGKKAMGIKVVNADGSEVQGGQAWKRAISRYLMQLTYVLGFIDSLMVFSRNRRTLHDRFAKTLVVNVRS